MIAEGRNINVTLIFSLERYDEIIEAYLAGLEALADSGGDLSTVRSVASFFVSRVDTEVDRRLEAIGTDEALALRGKAAVAQAKLAYQLFRRPLLRRAVDALRGRGATVQRPLWASTSTKNPDYPDTLYVDTLIGPDTVNTMPEATLDAFEDHGAARPHDRRRRRRGRGPWSTGWPRSGVDLDDVAARSRSEGVAAFAQVLRRADRRRSKPRPTACASPADPDRAAPGRTGRRAGLPSAVRGRG